MAALSDLDLSKMEDVKQSVTCGICLQIFNDPRALSCSHTYCLICLQGFQTSSSKKKNCPECRKDSIPVKQDLAGLPVNQLAVKLVDLVHKYDPESKGKCHIYMSVMIMSIKVLVSCLGLLLNMLLVVLPVCDHLRVGGVGGL